MLVLIPTPGVWCNDTLAVRTRGGLSWAALVNTRNRGSSLAGDLDKLIWTMARRVPGWRA